MYDITKLLNGKWLVECRIQDGTERWQEDTREKAVQSLISGARVLNHSFIREDDISFHEEQPAPPTYTQGGKVISKDDEKLLSDIKRGAKRVLDFDHFLVQYRITQEEADLILDIREGKAKVTRNR